jgi:4-hydroxy 2-oxovalerate aldolase
MITPKILDCTIRDGGYVNNWNFTLEQVRECYKSCSLAGVNYMEIGFRNRKTIVNSEQYGDTFFCEEEYINKVIDGISGCKLAVMVTINEFNMEDFLVKKLSNISLVRVLMPYHGGKNGNDNILDMKQLHDGITQIQELIKMGYDVAFNIGRIDKISKEQLYEICKLLSDINIKYFVMADTYGSVDLEYIEELIPYVKSLFRDVFNNKHIKIGFHAHDNLSNGTIKALYSLKFGVEIIDGCTLGFGRGSGNAKTELLLMHLNKHYNTNYDFIQLMNYGDKYIIKYKECNTLSYNIIYALTAYIGCHVSYAIDIIEKFEILSIIDIYNILIQIKIKNKHMFYDNTIFMQLYNNKE